MSGIHRVFEVLRKSQLAKAQEPKKANWMPLTDTHINQEYEWEYPRVKAIFGDIWPTVEHFRQAVKGGTVTPISPEDDHRMTNRSHTSNLNELKSLVSSYRFPRDVDRIARGLQNGDKLPTPIVLRHPKTGQMHIMSGNTRMDTANIMGYQPHATIVDMPVSEKPKKTGALGKSGAGASGPGQWRRVFDLFKSESEHLEKGSMQRRYKYDPNDRTMAVDKKLYGWQTAAKKDVRESLPHMKGNARERALHKLAGKTRTIVTENGRYYLLHRGMGHDEHRDTVKADENLVHHPETRSSWTPDYKQAQSFASDYGTGQNGVASAWVHENDIVTIPRQYGNYAAPQIQWDLKGTEKWPKKHQVREKNSYEHEYEVVLRRGHKSHLTRPAFRDLPQHHEKHVQDLHNRINVRGRFDPRKPMDNPKHNDADKKYYSQLNQQTLRNKNKDWAWQRKTSGLTIGSEGPTRLPDNVHEIKPKKTKEPAVKKPKPTV